MENGDIEGISALVSSMDPATREDLLRRCSAGPNEETLRKDIRTQQRFKRIGERRRKMIYRKWSLLTGPTSIIAGVVATVAVANFILVKNDPFTKPGRKFGDQPATK
ncbi:hypothetical protein P8452_62635 [Trifolium repens]|nr:hypothetical protein P8452_62635 [Trifolium repens]